MRPAGFKLTEKTKAKIAESHKRGKYYSCLECSKRFWVRPYYFDVAKFCSRQCKGRYWFLRNNPNDNPTLRAKMSAARRGKPILKNRGSGNSQWRGGKTAKHLLIRHSVEYKNWRNSVFARDNHTCQMCNARSGVGNKIYIVADHIKPFALYPELRLNTDNG